MKRYLPIHHPRLIPALGAAAMIGALLSGPIASARHHGHAAEGAPGDFAYYLLSLSWSPAFCLGSPGASECNGPRRYGFIVHGLWPQNEQGWPENCDVSPVPEEVVQSVSDIMPARKLVYHEWSAHGTCSGLQPAEFFALVRRAYAGVSIPRTSYGQATLPSVSRSALEPGDIIEFAGDTHVGIYVGGGMLIDAPQPGMNVERVSLNSSWYSANFAGAVQP